MVSSPSILKSSAVVRPGDRSPISSPEGGTKVTRRTVGAQTGARTISSFGDGKNDSSRGNHLAAH
jgi:hypothetical protein